MQFIDISYLVSTWNEFKKTPPTIIITSDGCTPIDCEQVLIPNNSIVKDGAQGAEILIEQYRTDPLETQYAALQELLSEDVNTVRERLHEKPSVKWLITLLQRSLTLQYWGRLIMHIHTEMLLK